MFRGLHLIPPHTNINFMRWRYVGLGLSIFLTLASIVLFFTRGLNYGIDFLGGSALQVQMPQEVTDLAPIREKLEALKLGEVTLQLDATDKRNLLVRIGAEDEDPDKAAARATAVHEALGQDAQILSNDFVGPTVGNELKVAGIWATLLALVGICAWVWFRYEWQFALAAMLALLHDVISTVGLFSLLQLDFNTSTLAALLTIAGYSMNDTVVIFDRIREQLRRYKTMDILELLNLALNTTLSRTVMTTATTLLAVLALYFLGGEVLRSFTTAMLWGIFIGTYSTILVAVPVLVYFRLRKVPAKPASRRSAPAQA